MKESFIGYDGIFATRLRELMALHKVTQQQLSEKADISRQAVSQYCDGSTTPNAIKLFKIAQFFNVSSDYLLGLTNAKTTESDIQSICKYTGLSDEAVKVLHETFEKSKSDKKKSDDEILRVGFLMKKSLNERIQRYNNVHSGDELKLLNFLNYIIENHISFFAEGHSLSFCYKFQYFKSQLSTNDLKEIVKNPKLLTNKSDKKQENSYPFAFEDSKQFVAEELFRKQSDIELYLAAEHFKDILKSYTKEECENYDRQLNELTDLIRQIEAGDTDNGNI